MISTAEKNDRFLRACRREDVDATPIWLMRQAGRYLPEYREIRKEHTVLEIAKAPRLSARVTLLPLDYFDLDAAIIFADIMLPLEPMGMELTIKDDLGPLIANPVEDQQSVKALQLVEPQEQLGFVIDAIRIVREKLAGKAALIGFSGAPFTLASYMIEGRPSRDFTRTKRLMYTKPSAWDELMSKLTAVIVDYLRAQVNAGVQALQIFDSWVGHLSPTDYVENVFPHMKRLFENLSTLSVPLIHFGTGTAMLLRLMRRAGGDVIGVDWRIPIDEAWKTVGFDVGIQGNLDPAVLLGSRNLIEMRAKEILDRAQGRRGHVFNLGHGVLPETPTENVAHLVNFVHAHTSRKR